MNKYALHFYFIYIYRTTNFQRNRDKQQLMTNNKYQKGTKDLYDIFLFI